MGYELCPGRNASLAPYTSTMQKTEVLQKTAAKKTILKWTTIVSIDGSNGLQFQSLIQLGLSKIILL